MTAKVMTLIALGALTLAYIIRDLRSARGRTDPAARGLRFEVLGIIVGAPLAIAAPFLDLIPGSVAIPVAVVLGPTAAACVLHGRKLQQVDAGLPEEEQL